MRRPLALVLLLAFGWTVSPGPLRAQELARRAHLDWRTIETRHFRVHYPAELTTWAHSVAQRLDAVHGAVAEIVGYAPPRRIDVIIDDPLNVANGAALPILDAPAMVFWAAPPDPRSQIGNNRSWAEVLAVHEFAHLAHLMRPSRSPLRRLRTRLLPLPVSPMVLRSPRWVIEGYATYVEGKLTGTGRPHGAWRAALLRQWALEGKLPSYAQLSSWDAFQGGAFAYQAGSAFLEWLVERRGDSSLVHLWRRMTARVDRGFVDAFRGVYGDTPQDLYDRFTAEVTGKALAVERALVADSARRGETVQALAWGTGDPALSPDGKHVAVVRRYRDRPADVVLWATAPPPEDTAAQRRRARQLRRDPQDVPAIESGPRPRKAVATLRAVAGASYGNPRFLPDGRRLLVTRFAPRGDGSLRPDLFLWDHTTGRVRRVTHGAAVRMADPAPDGRSAAGIRCAGASCDLVRIDLERGTVETVLRGANDVAYYRPRHAADGRLVFAVQREGRWRVGLLEPGRREPRLVDPDDGANRYDATFTADGRALVLVSERDGVPNVVRLDLATGAERMLTRVTGAAVAPEPSASERAVYFLRLHSKGYDVARVADSLAAPPAAPLDTALAPVVPIPPVRADTFAVGRTGEPRAYGLGPRQMRVLLGSGTGPDGDAFRLALVGSDPVGRLIWIVQGTAGTPREWDAASVSLAWRRFRPVLRGELYAARQTVSQSPGAFADTLNAAHGGASLAAELRTSAALGETTSLVGVSFGELYFRGDRRFVDRRLSHVQLGGVLRGGRGARLASAGVGLHASAGATDGVRWSRGVATATLQASTPTLALRLDALYAQTGHDAPAFERFLVGGAAPPVSERAVLSQRLAMPALPTGALAGRRVTAYRATLPRGLLSPYYWLARTDSSTRWNRVVGVEGAMRVDPVPLVGLPELDVVAGAGYSLDAPLRRRARGYVSLTYRP